MFFFKHFARATEQKMVYLARTAAHHKHTPTNPHTHTPTHPHTHLQRITAQNTGRVQKAELGGSPKVGCQRGVEHDCVAQFLPPRTRLPGAAAEV